MGSCSRCEVTVAPITPEVRRGTSIWLVASARTVAVCNQKPLTLDR